MSRDLTHVSPDQITQVILWAERLYGIRTDDLQGALSDLVHPGEDERRKEPSGVGFEEVAKLNWISIPGVVSNMC